MKKEAYYTQETITEKSRAMLLEVGKRCHVHSSAIVPERTALLVLDMQNYFLDPASHAFIPSAVPIVKNIREMVRVFVTEKRPVIFTRHENTPGNAGRMASWWRDMVRPGTEESRLIDAFDDFNNSAISKSQYDAFLGTSLGDLLEVQSVRQVVVTGVMAHLCCETTSRSAFMRGYEVFFVVDATADLSETFHCASLLNLAHGFAVPILTADVISDFKNYED